MRMARIARFGVLLGAVAILTGCVCRQPCRAPAVADEPGLQDDLLRAEALEEPRFALKQASAAASSGSTGDAASVGGASKGTMILRCGDNDELRLFRPEDQCLKLDILFVATGNCRLQVTTHCRVGGAKEPVIVTSDHTVCCSEGIDMVEFECLPAEDGSPSTVCRFQWSVSIQDISN